MLFVSPRQVVICRSLQPAAASQLCFCQLCASCFVCDASRPPGNSLLLMEAHSTNYYWHVKASNAIYPVQYEHNIVGIVHEMLVEFQTFFGLRFVPVATDMNVTIRSVYLGFCGPSLSDRHTGVGYKSGGRWHDAQQKGIHFVPAISSARGAPPLSTHILPAEASSCMAFSSSPSPRARD